MNYENYRQVPNITFYIPKGDTWTITVGMTLNGAHRDLVAGEIIYFSIKENISDTSYVLQKEISSFTPEGKAIVLLTPAETLLLTNKKYKYDCQFSSTLTGEIYTLFKGTLVIDTDNVTEEGA